MSEDIAKRVGQYVSLRDEIKRMDDEHKEKMAPYKETLEQLNGALLKHLQDNKCESAKTTFGTIYRSLKASASVKDMEAFWAYVVTQGEWDLLDKKANITAVKTFIEEHSSPPPGINFTQREVVGVRRS